MDTQPTEGAEICPRGQTRVLDGSFPTMGLGATSSATHGGGNNGRPAGTSASSSGLAPSLTHRPRPGLTLARETAEGRQRIAEALAKFHRHIEAAAGSSCDGREEEGPTPDGAGEAR